MVKRILIVEDQPDIRKLIRMTLEFDGYELYEATDGSVGLGMAQSVRPDVMLLDVMMPGELDGYQVCRKVKDDARLARTSVIMLTARGQESDLALGKQAGANGYLIKPFSPLELIDTVQRFAEAA